MRNTKSICCLALWSLVLMGCSSSSSKNSYIYGSEGKPLQLPSDLTSSKIASRYEIPLIDVQTALQEEFEVPQPPDATAALGAEPYLIQELGNEIWLELYSAPDNVWPLLGFFWKDVGVTLSSSDIQLGSQKTSVLASDSQPDFISQIEAHPSQPILPDGSLVDVRVRHGLRRNTSEVLVTTRLPNAYIEWMGLDGQNVDQKYAPRVDKAILDLIGQFITSEDVANRHSFVASSIGDGALVHLLETSSGQPFIQLNVSRERAWSEIFDSAQASGLVISDSDETAGIIEFSYLSQDDMDSWYLSDGAVSLRSQEKNFSLRMELDDSSKAIRVYFELLNPLHENVKANEVLSLVFEHIS